MFENVHIADNHGKRSLAIFIDIQNFFKRTAVQCVGQYIMLGPVADELLRLPIFAVDLVVSQCQILQLGRAYNRENLAFLDAFAVLHQRLYHQTACHGANFYHKYDKNGRTEILFAVNVDKDRLRVALPAADQFHQAVQTLGNFFCDIVTRILVLAVSDELLCLAQFVGIRHRHIAIVQRNALDFLWPCRKVNKRCLRHKPHGIPVCAAQVLRGHHDGFQQGESLGVAVIFPKIF